jgi:uncharacterized protein YraI
MHIARSAPIVFLFSTFISIKPGVAETTYHVKPNAPAVSEGYLNMRTGPGQQHPIVAAIPAGTGDVVLAGRCVDPNDGISTYQWCPVRWNGHIGWVSSGGLQADNGSGIVQTTQYCVNAQAQAVSEGYLNMRSGPGQRHVAVAAIPADDCGIQKAGQCIRPDDGVSFYDWCLVEWNGKTGWVSAGGLRVYDHEDSLR